MEASSVEHPERLLTRCDTEPIHVPGAIQQHGGLMAFDPGDQRVVYTSKNLRSLLEFDVEPLGATVDDLLGPSVCRRLTTAADTATTDLVPEDVTLRSGRAMGATSHTSDGLIIVEFEAPAPRSARGTLLHEVRRSVQRIEAANNADEACAAAVNEARRLTSYTRVVLYRFHDDEHGEVVAESRREDIESYLGLHYPATDIPRPARRLLRISPIRLIVDVNAVPVPISGSEAFSGRPLDLSRSALRAVSPIHLHYLRNMGVAGSLTISLTDGPRLWGLLACHHDVAMLPSPELRSACSIIAGTLWLKIHAQDRLDEQQDRERRVSLRAHHLATIHGVKPLAEALVEDGHSLLDTVRADGVFLRIDDVATSLGATPSREEIEALMVPLRAMPATTPVVTEQSSSRFEGLALAPEIAAGILAMPIADGWQEHVLWFRGEVERTRTWAGDPSKPILAPPIDGIGGAPEPVADDLSPRSSFAAWSETMRGRAPAWSHSDQTAAIEFVAVLPALRAARSRDALATLALRDDLTGLPNRALLLDRLEVALAELRRGGGSLWVLFLDLDGFKNVNDTYGHEAGDQLLVEVASRLRGSVRSADTVARLGGDEFVIICSEYATTDAIEQLADRLLESIAAPFPVQAGTCAVTASIGIAEIDKEWSATVAIKAADTAMYRAKRQGRNRSER